MRLVLIILSILSISFMSELAAAMPVHPTPKLAPGISEAATIILYHAPQANAQVLEKVNPQQRLVAIYRQGDWIKVGDVHNGNVGWINRQQYQQAMNKYFQSDIQTVYISTASNGKNTPNIVAYENGKKLSDKEAKELYQRIHKQQIEQARYMQQMFWNMQNVVDQQKRDFDQEFDPRNELNIGFMPLQPIIVINTHQK